MGVPAEHCVAGFEYGTTADGGKRLVKIGTAANPATTAASGATNDRTFHSRRGTVSASLARIAVQPGDHRKVVGKQACGCEPPRLAAADYRYWTVTITVAVVRPNSFAALRV
jgi:hypothetical protein